MPFSAEILQRLDALLCQRIGLKSESIGSGVAVALSQRMQQLGLTANDYLDRLAAQPNELQQLIETVVVPETWFFRDMTPFRCLQHVAKEFARSWRGRPLRVLSIPCSTGEEPYSAAVVLLAAGLNPHQFSVEAVDISERSLARATQGHFSPTSFREKHPDCEAWRTQFFTHRDGRFYVCSEARQRVQFRQGNLVDANFLKKSAPFDVVLCRNLLIYFDGSAREVAMTNLKRLLAVDGILYSGHAEAVAFATSGFRSFDKQFPFAFRHADNPNFSKPPSSQPQATLGKDLFPLATKSPVLRTTITTTKPTSSQPTSTLPSPERKSTPNTTGATTFKVIKPAPSTASVSELLQQARLAADQGRLAAALLLAEPLTQSHPSNVDAWCLLGIIQQASGMNLQAQRSFEKALFLDGRHEESLIHLALLHQLQGDASRANLYRQRLASL